VRDGRDAAERIHHHIKARKHGDAEGAPVALAS
jgi:hypothetical protein